MMEDDNYNYNESKETDKILTLMSKQNKCKKCSSYILPISGGIILLGVFISSFFINLDEILNPSNNSNTSIDNSVNNNNITYSMRNHVQTSLSCIRICLITDF